MGVETETLVVMSESWDRTKPWTATAKGLVLYRTGGNWRFAIYGSAGIIDGALCDLDSDSLPATAQARLLDAVFRMTGRTYQAKWREDKPGWWTADLSEEAP